MDFLNNHLLISLSAGVLTFILLKIHNNFNNEKMSNTNTLKIVLLVVVMSLFSFLLHGFGKNTKVKIDQDIFTGSPNF
tara:strand:+ start:688 stop:921 length:234 start_codon:yes stop_codon:yes gene_type:complete